MQYIEQAIELDALVPMFRDSREVIVRHLRRKLVEAAGPVELPGMYQVLLQAGEADEACHLAMARLWVECPSTGMTSARLSA